MRLDSRPSRSLPIKHMPFLDLSIMARAYVSECSSPSRDPSDRASLGLCAATRHPEERLHVHRSHAMASLTIGGPLSIPLTELCAIACERCNSEIPARVLDISAEKTQRLRRAFTMCDEQIQHTIIVDISHGSTGAKAISLKSGR